MPLMDAVYGWCFQSTIAGRRLAPEARRIQARYRMLLRGAERFVLDDDAVRLVCELSHERNRLIGWSFLARLPYDTLRIEYDTHVKMNPPLRDEMDRIAILEGIADGTVDAIATDHAPHHYDEKDVEFDRAPFGITGLETAVSLSLDRLVHSGAITLPRLIELMAKGPARILGVPGGSLSEGAPADVTILAPDLRVTVSASAMRSTRRVTPPVVRATSVLSRLIVSRPSGAAPTWMRTSKKTMGMPTDCSNSRPRDSVSRRCVRTMRPMS